MDSFIAVDIETTGLNCDLDRIIEVSAVRFSGGEITDTYSSLVFTSKEIAPYIEQLTGISNEMVQSAPKEEFIKTELINFCGQQPLVFHNASFDISFLERFFNKPIENQILDTLEMTRVLFPALPSYNLNSLAHYFEIPLPKHRALDDAISCGNLLLRCMEKISNLKPHILSLILTFLKYSDDYLGYVVEQQYYRNIWESKVDSQEFRFRSIIPKYKHPEATEPPKPLLIDEFTLEKIETLLSCNGSFLNKFPNFEFRPGQMEMLRQICQSFLEGRLFVAEAATGTGKSLAYLLPAILWSILKDEKVVISTHTINLQEQLSNNDLPIIEHMLGLENFCSAILKGRNNYLCLNKLQQQFNSAPQNSPKLNYFLARIVNWLDITALGDKTELNLKKDDHEHWISIAADSYSCLGNKCEFFSDCYVTHAKKKAERAKILITNHSMLLSDIKTSNGVLPNFKYLIIDEAHNLEQESISHLTIECSSYLLNTITRNLKLTLEGLALSMKRFRKKQFYSVDNECFAEIDMIYDKAITDLNALGKISNEFRASIRHLWFTLEETDQNQAKWLRRGISENDEWILVNNVAQNVIFRLLDLTKHVSKIIVLLKDIQGFSYNLNIHFYSQICQEYASNLSSILNLDIEDKVTWLETYSNDMFSLKQAPLEVGEILAEKIYQEKECVIFTSATLTVENSFSFFNEQVGLDLAEQERICAHIYQSPFNFEKQATLCIPTNLPNPADLPSQYESILYSALEQMITANKGRTLVLFTSRQQLLDCYYCLKESLQEQNIKLLAHHIDGSRTSILERFKQQENSVLFGTNSFWEGVDIPGNSLTLLIIMRLPFQAPGIPTLAAKMEYFKKNKRDPFSNLNLPQAIIRFKQGFGRLVRTKQDSGFVVVLDKRIIEKFYGKRFLGSLPLKTHFRGEFQDIVQEIAYRNKPDVK